MSKRDPSVLLEDIQTALNKIQRYIAEMEKEAFLADDKTTDAVIRNLEIIGEAVRHLPADFKNRYDGVPWAQIVGMRNRIVHDYAGVDLEIVWQVITSAFPDFKIQLASLGLVTGE